MSECTLFPRDDLYPGTYIYPCIGYYKAVILNLVSELRFTMELQSYVPFIVPLESAIVTTLDLSSDIHMDVFTSDE